MIKGIGVVVTAITWHLVDLGAMPTSDLFSKMVVVGGSGVAATVLAHFIVPKEVVTN
ncbi:MAG: hypothetical protein KJ674_05700 [Nanoarchaeota archaeon]|nr:hypothetical protein [Nanoarchaeota archaeon]